MLDDCLFQIEYDDMVVTKQLILDETKNWPEEAVSDLIDSILLAKHGGEYLEAWQATARMRLEEIDSGQAEAIPGEKVRAKIARIVAR